MIAGRDFWQGVDPSVVVMTLASLTLAALGLMWSVFYLIVRLLGWTAEDAA